MIRTVGAMIGAAEQARELVGALEARLAQVRSYGESPGFAHLPAVLDCDMYEIKSPLILQPGPAALTDGLAALQNIIEDWAARN